MIIRGLAAALLLCALSLSACSEFGFGGPPVAGASNTEPTAFDKYYAAGKQQMAADRLGLAIVDFERALALDPRSVRALNALGACYDDLHRYDVAMGFYKKALAIEPKSADTLNNMAVSLAMAGFPTDAEYTLRKAASLDPGNKTIQLNMASMNSLGAARAAPKRVEIPAVVDAAFDPRRPRIERTGVQSYMLHISKKLPTRVGLHPAAPLAHEVAQHGAASAFRHRHGMEGARHAAAISSKAGHKHTRAVTRPVDLATNIRSRSSAPEWTYHAHWR